MLHRSDSYIAALSTAIVAFLCSFDVTMPIYLAISLIIVTTAISWIIVPTYHMLAISRIGTDVLM